jgi:hypothetical protein
VPLAVPAIELDRNIDQTVGEIQDVGAGLRPPRITPIQKECQLFKGLSGTSAMDTRDGVGVTEVDLDPPVTNGCNLESHL